MSATQTVLSIAELLELILSFLPFKSLLTCRKVSLRFHAIIAQSLTLQEHLFVKPARNHIYRRPQQRYIPANDDSPFIYVTPADHRTGCRTLINPVILSAGRKSHSILREVPLDGLLKLNPPPPSWQHLYLTRPPVTSMHVYLEWVVQPPLGLRGFVKVEGRVTDERGFTYERMCEAALEKTPSLIVAGATQIWMLSGGKGNKTARSAVRWLEERFGAEGRVCGVGRSWVSFGKG